MSKQVSDEKMDEALRRLMSDAAADEATVQEIADSPQLWWAVQRQITGERAQRESAWPPVEKLRRWFMIGVPVAAALVLMAIFFLRMEPSRDHVAIETYPAETIAPPAPISHESTTSSSTPVTNASSNKTDDKPDTYINRIVPTRAGLYRRSATRKTGATTAAIRKTEVTSDFIALSYAQNAESGQVVRVKVPSSMMVTLGLVSHVENPKNLIDAEVVVGDDGLTRAIRFIR